MGAGGGVMVRGVIVRGVMGAGGGVMVRGVMVRGVMDASKPPLCGNNVALIARVAPVRGGSNRRPRPALA
jgi:hypothetical protein